MHKKVRYNYKKEKLQKNAIQKKQDYLTKRKYLDLNLIILKIF